MKPTLICTLKEVGNCFSRLGPFSWPSYVWLVLLIGAFVHVPVFVTYLEEIENASALRKLLHISTYFSSAALKEDFRQLTGGDGLPGFFINFSLFDLIVPILGIWALTKRGLANQISHVLILVLTTAIIVAAHSTAMFLFMDGMNDIWLLKESIKLLAVIIEFGLLVIIFQIPELRKIPTNIVVFCLVIALPITILNSRYELNICCDNYLYMPRTVLAVGLIGFLFFLASEATWLDSIKRRISLIAVGILILPVTVLAYSKMAAGMGSAITAWLLLCARRKDHTQTRLVLIIVTLVAIALIGAFILPLIKENVSLVSRMDSWDRSIGVRLHLWRFAITQMWSSFPFGVGLGQFPIVAEHNPVLAEEGHKFIHNSILSLTTELGIVGFGIVMGIIIILRRAVKGFPWVVAPIFLVLVIPPIVIHDGHSIRMLILVTAYGYARYLYGLTNDSTKSVSHPKS